MSRNSVLISYFFGDDMIPLGESCADAFGALGYEVARFNSQVESRWQPVLFSPLSTPTCAVSAGTSSPWSTGL